MSPPCVSIVVPNFNGAEFLDDTLRSLVEQTSGDFEVLVIDGGSTDDSLDIVKRWSPDLSLSYVSEPDDGQAHAINKGFARASGEILTWLNSDDLLVPTAISTASNQFLRRDLDFVWSFCLVVDPELNPLHIANPFARTELSDLRRHRNFIPQPGSFYSRRLLEQVGPLRQEMHYAFDYEFFLRAAAVARAQFVPEVLAWFRLHPASKTSTHAVGFRKEEWRAFRLNGGQLGSPFTLDMIRYWYIERLVDCLKGVLRPLVWRVLGLQKGSRIRP